MAKFSSTFKCKRNIAILMGLVALVGTACDPRGTDLGRIYQPLFEETVPEVVTFEYLNTKVFGPSCASCHFHSSDFTSEQAMIDNGYITPGNAAASPAFTTMADGSMPKDGTPVPAPLQDAVKNYINKMGAPAPEPSPSPEPAPTDDEIPEEVNFEYLQAKVFNPSCASCHYHKDNFTSEQVLIDSGYLTPGSLDDSPVYTTILDGSMPKGNKPPVTPALLEALKGYIEKMAP